MTTTFQDVKLQFDQITEYSTDGGTVWTTLAANTPHIVAGSLIATSKKVMIRSTASDIILDKTLLEWDTKSFSTINIKNGTALTNLHNVFRGMSVTDTLQLINIPRVTSLYAFAYNSVINNVILGNIPDTCTSVANAFNNSIINYISGLNIKHEVDMRSVLSDSSINYLGDVSLKSTYSASQGNLSCGRTLRNSTVDSFGKVSLNLQAGYNDSPNRENLSYLDAPYILSGDLTFNKSTAAFQSMTNTTLHFTGLNVRMINGSLGSGTSFYSSNPNLIYPFASIYKNTGLYAQLLESTPNLTSDILASQIADIRSNSTPIQYLEVLEWLPSMVVLHNDIGVALINKTSIGAKGLLYYMYEGTSPYVTQTVNSKVQPAKMLTSVHSSVVGYASDIVYCCRNGSYGVYDAGVVTIFNVDDVQIGTISTTEINGANFNQIGTQLLTAQGGKVDTSSTTDQTITSSVVVYDTTTGSIVTTIVLSDKTNTELVGVYQPTGTSGMHLLYNRYEDVGGTMTLVESYVESYLLNVLEKTTILDNIVDYMTNHYAEDNEFNCINRTTGRVLRCFGR